MYVPEGRKADTKEHADALSLLRIITVEQSKENRNKGFKKAPHSDLYTKKVFHVEHFK